MRLVHTARGEFPIVAAQGPSGCCHAFADDAPFARKVRDCLLTTNNPADRTTQCGEPVDLRIATHMTTRHASETTMLMPRLKTAFQSSRQWRTLSDGRSMQQTEHCTPQATTPEPEHLHFSKPQHLSRHNSTAWSIVHWLRDQKITAEQVALHGPTDGRALPRTYRTQGCVPSKRGETNEGAVGFLLLQYQ